MRKVFLGIKDTNYIFLSRFLEHYNYQYDLTIGYIGNRFELPKLKNKINLNFLNLSTLNKYSKISYLESIISDHDLVISNHICYLSLAAKNCKIPYIQYSDLYMFHELARNKEVLFGKLAKTHLRHAIFNEDELDVYEHANKNFIYNPLIFFHDFRFKSPPNILCPFYLQGNPQQEGPECVISYTANKSIMKPKAIHLSAIEDFGYMQSDFIGQSYYDFISSCSNIKIDLDYNLLGDCLFNNIRPEISFLEKTLNNFYLYNFARVLNLSKVVDSIPYAKVLDEKQYPTFDQTIMEFL